MIQYVNVMFNSKHILVQIQDKDRVFVCKDTTGKTRHWQSSDDKNLNSTLLSIDSEFGRVGQPSDAPCYSVDLALLEKGLKENDLKDDEKIKKQYSVLFEKYSKEFDTLQKTIQNNNSSVEEVTKKQVGKTKTVAQS